MAENSDLSALRDRAEAAEHQVKEPMSINHEANEYARTFDRVAKMHGYDLRMETLAELIALVPVEKSTEERTEELARRRTLP